MATPLITLAAVALPAEPFNLSNAVSLTGTWNQDEGDTGADWCLFDRGTAGGNAFGQGRVRWQLFSNGTDPLPGTGPDNLFSTSHLSQDADVNGAPNEVNISTDAGYVYNGAYPGQINTGVFCTPPADNTFTRKILTFGQVTYAGSDAVWTITLSVSDGSAAPKSVALLPNARYAVQGTYVSRTPCTARFEIRRTAGSGQERLEPQVVVLYPPVKNPISRGCFDQFRKSGVFGGSYV